MAVTAARLRILGGFSLSTADGQALSLPTRKDRLLLSILALSASQPQPREKLYSLLWGDRGETQARGSLSQSLLAIRNAFKPAGIDPVLATRDTVLLHLQGIEVDAVSFAAAAADPGRSSEALAAYGGELLSGVQAPTQEAAEWLRGQRQRFDDLAATLADRVSRGSPPQPSINAALKMAAEIISRDPLREPLYRSLMRLHVLNRDRAQALKAYAACRDTLRRELSVTPELETEQLYRDIVTGRTMPEPDHTVPVETPHGKPALAVLPFDNMPGSAELAPLCEGLAEEIITGLGRFRFFDIIDRNSSSAVAKRSTDTAQIGRQLGVQLLVTGNLQRIGERMRTTVKLVDAPSRRQLWSESYDFPADDLLLQPDRISREIVARLQSRVEITVLEQSRRKPRLAAYECLLKGIQHIRGFGHENNVAAIACFDQALALDPDYALAKAYRAFADVVLHDYDAAPRHILDDARRRGEEAVEMEPDNARSLWLLAMTCSYLSDFETDARLHRRALELNPNDANVLASYGLTLTALGKPEDGIALMREAMRANPYHPEWYWLDLGSMLYVAGRYADAIEAFKHKRDPKQWVLLRLAACYGQLGMAEECRQTVAEILSRNPGFRLSNHRAGAWRPAERLHFREGMLKAGLPE